MNVINFQDANCAHCYKCLRNCDIKAIRIKKGQAQIVQDLCIYCGHCMEICPQEAKSYESDIQYVKRMLENHEDIVVSLDPSYLGLLNFGNPGQVVSALKKLGFQSVRATAEGAGIITEEYVRLIKENKMENIITTTCPAIINLVEKHYPMLTPYLAPVVSPMIAHGKLIRKEKGNDVKIVYIGPCVAKKMEAEMDTRTRGVIDAVIEFTELQDWFDEVGIDPHQCESTSFDNIDSKVNRLYPVPTGIARALEVYGAPDNYIKMSISSIKNCREFLHSMKRGYIQGCFAELNLCSGGCVNGPGVDKRRGFQFKAAVQIERNAKLEKPDVTPTLPAEDLVRNYVPKQVVDKMPTEEEIKAILKTIGKSNSDTEFNCGACGYMTCREKAIAIYQGKAESAMCLIRSYENARSQANTVLDYIPSLVLVLDRNLKIKEFNKKAQAVFNTSRADALRMYLFDFIETQDFEEVYRTHQPKVHVKKKWEFYNMTVLQTIVYVENSDSILAIIEDVSADEKNAEKRLERKLESVRMAQEVIEKQMMTAQQIAELLGETTAETKVSLTKLRDYILEEEV